MVLLAGRGRSENRRIRRSRILRAPQLVCSHVQDIVFHLKGKLVGIAKGAPAPVGESLHPAFLIAIEDLVAGLAGDSELPAERICAGGDQRWWSLPRQ